MKILSLNQTPLHVKLTIQLLTTDQRLIVNPLTTTQFKTLINNT
jgi:hypothetical protein